MPNSQSSQDWKAGGLSLTWRFAIVALLVILIALVLICRNQEALNNKPTVSSKTTDTTSPRPLAEPRRSPSPKEESTNAMPQLVDLGAGKCIPCKLMEPILSELQQQYAGKLKVVVIDILKHPEAVQQYRIRVIPTQIFFDESRSELFRHEGFFSKDEILAKWAELGIDLDEDHQE